MSKRDLVSEIKQLKSRREFRTFYAVFDRIGQLNKTVSALSSLEQESRDELLKYIPVALISTVESFLRSAVKKLIDAEDCYLDNAKLLVDAMKLKIDYEVLKNIHKREFSMGEVISHHLSFKNFYQISPIFSRLLKVEDFLVALKKYSPTDPIRTPYSQTFIEGHAKIFKNIIDLYSTRNIICHETAADFKLTERQVKQHITCTFYFINQIMYYILDVLKPDVIESLEDQAKLAEAKFKERDTELKELIKAVVETPVNYLGEAIDVGKFLLAQNHWEEFRNLYCESHLAAISDPLLYRNDYFLALTVITEDRIDEIKMDFNNEDE